MTHTLEELQAALLALSELEDNEYWRRGDYSENHKKIRAVLEAAISKMETTTEQSSEVDDNGLKPCPFCGSKDIGGIAYTASPAEVYCYGCGATIKGKGIEATNKWNTRAEPQGVDVDVLANFIRKVDGDNTMGSGRLAEAITTNYTLTKRGV